MSVDRIQLRRKLELLVDRIAYHSLDDQDTLNTVRAIRRLCKGIPPSEILLEGSGRTPDNVQKARDLRQLIAELTGETDQLRREVAELTIKVAEEEHRLAEERERQRERESLFEQGQQYTDADFRRVLMLLVVKFGKINGGFARWAKGSARLHAMNPTIRVLTLNDLYRFKRANRFPAWAVEQLAQICEQPEVKQTRAQKRRATG